MEIIFSNLKSLTWRKSSYILNNEYEKLQILNENGKKEQNGIFCFFAFFLFYVYFFAYTYLYMKQKKIAWVG